jgi:Uma2 family endonuclease
MAEPVHRKWTVEEFFAWHEHQPDRYELVDGFPLKMMAGAKNVHDDIVVNLVAELRGLLRGGGCRPFAGDGAVETRPGQIRRTDVGVDCGARDPNGTLAASPRIIIEALAPSTRDFDSFKKLDEYKTIASVNAIILVEPNEPLACVWSRDETGQWRERTVRSLDAVIELPAPPIALRMEAIFDGVQFPASPRLVQSQESV